MKKIIERIKQDGVIEPIATIVFTILFLSFVVFPFLTEANTLKNIIGAIFGVGIIVFNYYYFSTFFVEENIIEPGETELDFIPPQELKPKKKKVVKKDKPIVKVQKKK